jgi:hypothetical protein
MYGMFKDKLQNCSLTNLNKYLQYDRSEYKYKCKLRQWKILLKKHCSSGKLIIAVYASIVYVYISCTFVKLARV